MSELTKIEKEEREVEVRLKRFELQQREAKALSVSAFFPQDLKGDVASAVIIHDLSRRMNISVLEVAQSIYIIYNRPSFSTTFMVARLNQSGLIKGALRSVISQDRQSCYASAIDAQTGEELKGMTVTMEIAKAEGWLDSVYFTVAFILLLGLGAMDYMYTFLLSEAYRRMDNNEVKPQNKNFNPDDYRIEEPMTIKREPIEEPSKEEEYHDEEFLEYIAEHYANSGKVPSTQTIAEGLNKSVGTISNIYKRNEHYFIRENGKATEPTELFLRDYNFTLEGIV